MISNEDFINLYNKFKNSIILLYNRIIEYIIKRSHASKAAKNKKQIKSISNKNHNDDNLDVVAVKIKKVTVKKK